MALTWQDRAELSFHSQSLWRHTKWEMRTSLKESTCLKLRQMSTFASFHFAVCQMCHLTCPEYNRQGKLSSRQMRYICLPVDEYEHHQSVAEAWRLLGWLMGRRKALQMIDSCAFVCVCVCMFSQCVAGYGCAGLCRDVSGEASAAPLWGVCVCIPAEHAQPRAGLNEHQRDTLTEESKGGLRRADGKWFSP